MVYVDATDATEEASFAIAGLAPTRTRGPGALESLVEVIASDESAPEDIGGVNPVTCSAMVARGVEYTLEAKCPSVC